MSVANSAHLRRRYPNRVVVVAVFYRPRGLFGFAAGFGERCGIRARVRRVLLLQKLRCTAALSAQITITPAKLSRYACACSTAAVVRGRSHMRSAVQQAARHHRTLPMR